MNPLNLSEQRPAMRQHSNAPLPAQPAPPPRCTNGFAMAALVCAVFGIWPMALIGPILALTFGWIGLDQIRRCPARERGRGLAVAALAIGGVELVATCAFMFILLTGRSGMGF